MPGSPAGRTAGAARGRRRCRRSAASAGTAPAPQHLDGLLGGFDTLSPTRAPSGPARRGPATTSALLGGDPPHQVVVGHEPVHVLQRHLRLADPAEPVQGLRQPPPRFRRRSWSRIRSRTRERPVKPGLRAGTFQILGTVPGKRGPGETAPSGGCTGRSSARSSWWWRAPRPAGRGPPGWSMNGAVSRTSPTRIGTSWRRAPAGSSDGASRPPGAHGLDVGRRAAPPRGGRPPVREGPEPKLRRRGRWRRSRGTTRKPARVSTDSIQSAHIRFSAT